MTDLKLPTWMDCKHEHATDYFDSGDCGTPYCSWTEYRCKDCRMFVCSCPCGSCNGVSGWPWKRWRLFWRRKESAVSQPSCTTDPESSHG